MSHSLKEDNYIGSLPSKVNRRSLDKEHGEFILEIAASFARALDYSPPPFPRDRALKAAAVRELLSWDIGEAVDGFMVWLDLGLAGAEVCVQVLLCLILG